MVTSNNTQKDFLLQLDDEEDNNNNRASIDTDHQFLNFSRKVTEASSMRKPVDIQLGIACGKDLLFNNPARMLRRPQPMSYNSKPSSLPPTSPPPLVRKKSNKKKTNNSDTTVRVVLPPTTAPAAKPKYTNLSPSPGRNTNKNNYTTSNAITTSSSQLSPSLVSPPPQQTQQQEQLTAITSSSLLDQLVADVLNHIESCPDHSAYSVNLDRLKPKLKAYSITRHSSPAITNYKK
jgi:hypothetical protein